MPRVREEAAGEPPAKRARPPPSFCRSEKVDSCNRRRPGRGLRTSWWRSCRWPPLFHIFSALAFLFRVCLEYFSSSFFPILRVFFLIFYFPPSSSILYFCPLPSIHFVLTEFACYLWCRHFGANPREWMYRRLLYWILAETRYIVRVFRDVAIGVFGI